MKNNFKVEKISRDMGVLKAFKDITQASITAL